MAETFHSFVLLAMKLALEKANMFALSCDEANSIVNQSSLQCMHISFKTRQGSLNCYP
jgi:hypothetical protein